MHVCMYFSQLTSRETRETNFCPIKLAGNLGILEFLGKVSGKHRNIIFLGEKLTGKTGGFKILVNIAESKAESGNN